MSSRASRRADEQELRIYAHQVVDKVSALQGDRLQAAAQALGGAPSDAARQLILEISVSAPDNVTAAFVQAAVQSGSGQLAQAASDLLMDLKTADAALDIISQCLESEDSSVRRRAVEALEVVADPGAADLLTSALGSEDASVRRAATNSLSLIIGSKYHVMKERLLEGLKDTSSNLGRTVIDSEDTQLRREVAQILSFAGSDSVLPTLARFSEDADVQTRREAVVALAAFGSAAALEMLERKLQDSDYVVVASVLDTLAPEYGRESPDMLRVLKKALEHSSAEIRRHAVLMLDHFPLSDVEETLRSALHDGDFEVERGAHELLRRLGSGASSDWFEGGAADRTDDQRTLMVWEAGSVGLESETVRIGGVGESKRLAASEDVLLLLERAAMEGDLSTRVHAVNEISELRDIADSPALQRAIHDKDEAVRSRAAGSLAYTRDAGLLVEVLEGHSDFLVRRRAGEALITNPGGAGSAGVHRRAIEFTSARTVGLELFSAFLAALNDADEGVKEIACNGLRRYVESRCPLPVPAAVRSVQPLADDESLSSQVRENADQLLEQIAETKLAEPIVNLTSAALEWRGQVAREAHALKRDAQSGKFSLDARAGLTPAAVTKGWPAELGLTTAQAEAAAQALHSGEPLPDEVALAVMRAMVHGLIGCLNAVYYSSRAVRVIGESRWSAELGKWADAMGGGPKLDWGEDERVRSWNRLLPRLRRRAGIAAAAAAEALKDSPDPAVLAEACADEDDWVRMVALVELGEMEGGPGEHLAELAQLCRSHADDSDFVEALGPAAIALLQAGQAEFIPVLESVLDRAYTDLRFSLTERLMVAAGTETAARALESYLSGKPLDRLGRFSLALALKGVGGDLEGLEVPASVPEEADVELRCACWGLRAMMGEEDAVAELAQWLRAGQGRQRYCSAVYLGLSRVRSAAPIFASVSDHDIPYALRSLCAAMLLRRGHPYGVGWFVKNAQNAKGLDKATMAANFGRAIENVISLMLGCKDVNLGRFV